MADKKVDPEKPVHVLVVHGVQASNDESSSRTSGSGTW